MYSKTTPGKSILTICFLSALFILTSFHAYSQLSGVKTINPSVGEGDYTTFTAAINDLITQGVNGPVTLNVVNGTYSEQVRIREIPGASSINTITIQSQSSDSAQVILTFSSTLSNSNWTLKIDSSDYITIREITIAATGASYARSIEINGTASNVTIENCRIIGSNTTSSNTEFSLIYNYLDPTNNITIQKNLFSNGSYGIYMSGPSTSVRSAGSEISNNVFADQSECAIWVKNQDAVMVNSNSIVTRSDPATGIYLEYCDKATQVQNNKMTITSGSYGIYLYNCDGNTIERGQIINNFVSVLSGTTANGIYLSGSSYQNIYHNSISITSVTSNDVGAFYLTGGSNIDIRNNIFANFGENYAYNIKTASAILFSDYNNYFSNGDYLGYWTNAVENLSDLITVSSKDVNSISYNPVFLSSTDLHTTSFRIDDKGTDLGITTDIDGEARVNHDIGADEFTGTGTALSGTYTIGVGSPDFATFNMAVTELNKFGISGPVTFNVINGLYNEQLSIWPIAGADISNPVVFQSASADPSQVELSFNSDISNNYLVRFVGADNLTFKNMSFTALNAIYSRIIWFAGSSSNIEVSSCILNGNITGVTADGIFYSYQDNVKNILILKNNVFGGRYGVYINSNTSSNYIKGTQIQQNYFTGQKGGSNDVVYLRYHDAPVVNENIITNTTSTDFYGIYLHNCINDLKVISNKISSNASYAGIYLNVCPSNNSKRGLVANNFIDIGGTSSAYGIYTYDADYQNIFYNSVRITSSNLTSGRAYYNNSNSGNINLINNIFANMGGGYASYTDGSGTPSALSADYNDYFTTGNYLAYWSGANQLDLAAYKSAVSPLDANSISVNPSFLSVTDLYTSSAFLDGGGVVLSEVSTDIDGEDRDLTSPDIGADEFSTVTSPIQGGTYTIGGDSPDYENFTSAVNDLNTKGISGPVIFDVRDGTYYEQISINDISGENDVNTITFQSQSGNTGLVELSFEANSNKKYVIELIGTDNISFKNMTLSATSTAYALVFAFSGGLQNLNIQNCVLNGNGGYGNPYDLSVIYSGNAVISNLLVENCQIYGGRSGIWLESPQASNSAGTIISNNILNGQYNDAIYLKYHDAPRVESNFISNATSGSFYGINLQYCKNDIQVLNNKVNVPTGDAGIHLYYCVGTNSKKGLVANNIIDIRGTSTAHGIYTYYSDYPRIYFNTVKISSTNSSSGYAYYNQSGSNVDVKNNIFSNFGGGYAYFANNITSVIISDFNNLYSTGNFLGYWNGNYTDLSAFRVASGKETNSVSVNPVFASADDLHTTSSYLDNKGTPVAAITTDYDGETRSGTTPDIGADEFTSTLFPMSGDYTIGGTDPDFASFSLAADALNTRGVAGPVTFKIRSGAYTEHFELFEITGASALNPIIFQSESGDSSSVSLSYNATSTVENYIIKLTGTDFITIRNMTIAGTNSSYSNLIVLNGNITQLEISNNILSMNSNSSSYAIFSADGNFTNNLLIRKNLIIEGGRGVYLDGNGSSKSPGLEISGNIFSNQNSHAIYLADQDGPEINGNIISANDYNFYGVSLNYCDGKLVITKNKITSDNYSYGIYLNYCNGTFLNQGLVANNLVTIRGNDYAYGIYISYSQHQNIYFNSVNIASTYSSNTYKRAFYLTGGAYINVNNNIFANTTGGYAYYISTPAAVVASDYNDYFSTTGIAYWGSDRANLTELRGANSMDTYSLSANPMFASGNDLRVTQTLLHKAATPVSLVTTDFYGITRDAIMPDIGAVEFYCTTPVFNVTASAVCLNDSTIFTDNSTGIAFGSTYSFDFNNDFDPDTTFSKGGSVIRTLYSTSGTHTVNFIVSQIAGCNDYIAINALVYPSPAIEVITTGVSCGNDNGSASVNITQASGPFSYQWSNGSTSGTVSNLAHGKHSVSVKSANNCVGSQTFEIDNAIIVRVTQVKPSTCGEADGKAYATVTGGTAPYSFVWSTGEIADTSYKLPIGAQYVNVTDAQGCSSLGSINIANDGSGPQINLIAAQNNNCYGEKTGLIDVTISGGAQPYTIQWSNGSTTEDLSDLPAGTYDLHVRDDAGCVASASYIIEQPVLLNVSTVVTNASCNGSDGQAVALVGGGNQPYKYDWTGGQKSPIAENLTAGVYSLKVTDNNLCSVIIPVLINNTGGPGVSFNKVTGTSCSDSTSGAIDINVSGGTPLYSFLWTPGGQTSQDLTNLAIGTYEVKVTDNAGCVGVNSVAIRQEAPQVNPICLVTVDSASGKNLVVWEKEYMTDVASYNIYRESSSKEIFQLIANIPVTEESQYLDLIADPAIRSWKYKISVVDVCGIESELSPAHKTIHLTQNLGLNNTVNLIWDSYEGFALNTYTILRYSTSEGWKTLGSLPSNLTSFTDANPLFEENLIYVIDAAHPDGSCSTLKAGTYNSSRSNRQSLSVKSTVGINPDESSNSLIIYPNPATDDIHLSLDQKNLKQVRVDIIDVKGQVVYNYRTVANENPFNTKIDISAIPKGIYILRIGSDNNVVFRKLVIE